MTCLVKVINGVERNKLVNTLTQSEIVCLGQFGDLFRLYVVGKEVS